VREKEAEIEKKGACLPVYGKKAQGKQAKTESVSE
jgi:hypothetical protein